MMMLHLEFLLDHSARYKINHHRQLSLFKGLSLKGLLKNPFFSKTSQEITMGGNFHKVNRPLLSGFLTYRYMHPVHTSGSIQSPKWHLHSHHHRSPILSVQDQLSSCTFPFIPTQGYVPLHSKIQHDKFDQFVPNLHCSSSSF